MLAMLGGVGPTEIVVVMLALALIFGASRIPEIGANLGKGIRNFKKSFTGEEEDEQNKLNEGKPIEPRE
jgi:sec-independent protein translocase protein TatA